jgi:hypothetical protein
MLQMISMNAICIIAEKYKELPVVDEPQNLFGYPGNDRKTIYNRP